MKAGFSLKKFIVVERDIPLGLGHKLDRGTEEPLGSVPQWAGVDGGCPLHRLEGAELVCEGHMTVE